MIRTISVLSVVVGVLAWNAVPDIESVLFPVAREMGVTIERVTESEICFEMAFVKLRAGRPVVFAWSLYSRSKPALRVTVLPVDPRSGDPMVAERTAPAGPGVVVYDRCVTVPRPLRGVPDLVIEAHALYEVPNRPWYLVRSIPPQSIGSTLAVSEP